MNEESQVEDQELEESQEHVDPPQEKNPHKRKPTWVREAIQGAQRYEAPEENDIERKRTRSYSGYVALLCDFIDKEPSNYEEAAERKEWKDAMIKEYQLIMKNDVWDVVPRLLPSMLYLVVFYQVNLVNQTRITCLDFRRPLEVLLGSACCIISNVQTPLGEL